MLRHFVDVAVEDDRLNHADDSFATVGAIGFPLFPLENAVLAERVTATQRRRVDEEFGANGALQLHLHGLLEISQDRLGGFQLHVSLGSRGWQYVN